MKGFLVSFKKFSLFFWLIIIRKRNILDEHLLDGAT